MELQHSNPTMKGLGDSQQVFGVACKGLWEIYGETSH